MTDSRRGFLQRTLTLAGALYASAFAASGQTGIFSRRAKAKASPAAQPLVYFGTDSFKPGSKGLYVSRFNNQTGQLSSPVLAAETVRPSFLAVNNARKGKILYAANEGNDERTSGVSAFAIDSASGQLRLLGKVTSAGAGPCYVAVDGSGSSVVIANYAGGTVASYKVQPDGTLSQPVSRIDFHEPPFGKPGPMKQRQDAPHPHCAMFSPTNRFVVVNDLGLDEIATFPVDTATGTLGKPTITATKPGSGPRHLAFHPNGRWVYAVDELSSRIDQYLWTMVHGGPGQVLAAQALLTDTGHSVSTLDHAYTGANTAAEIVIGPDGSVLYVSNRGENSLVMFRIDPTTGNLTLAQRIGCGGKTPRQFTLDPTGGWLLCGNQDSDSVAVFKRNQGDGRLSGPVQTLPIIAPQMTLFV